MASTFTATDYDIVRETVNGVMSMTRSYEISAALVLNDVIQMITVPNGMTVIDVILGTDDLDTDGSPAIVLDVGDGSDTDRFIDGATVGQAGGVASLNEVDGMGYTYTAEDTIDVLVQVAPATGATTGTIKLTVLGQMDGV